MIDPRRPRGQDLSGNGEIEVGRVETARVRDLSVDFYSRFAIPTRCLLSMVELRATKNPPNIERAGRVRVHRKKGM